MTEAFSFWNQECLFSFHSISEIRTFLLHGQKEPSSCFLDNRNADFQKGHGLPMAVKELTDFCFYDDPHPQRSGNHRLFEVCV